ncbi:MULTISPECIES: acyltransferase [unclassified Mesorhizobium]|uniref:acyltransferase family protein n=1 Tax=unclassified Mesorhizobium TaxID=325217 RepID=UPI000FCB1609|nr:MULTISPECIES: acyltransferase [unclassified Mesorhizobium]TGP27248.1 acyltransferase [Mesorhizobium sp. M1D.F.Ca.ET.231.01.1.1]TGP39206.1 acyltransferase [Mesorhizobium sp. M1D.F.Ca.ET.234.01.1.1]TGS51415.1 acyltransferase [Mesorhizobium sp. M1D.F.Ca.ET.184.01.1.1]TGS67299.1 acyltransferase [Mesorhizobium sp. M1D.F.Ca.ET.183.01.1.1]
MDQVLWERTSKAQQAAKQKYNNIQVLRAVAAGFVALYHSQHYLQVFVGPSIAADAFDGQWGFYGVAIFFAISGFLMGDLIHRNDAWTFILHRAVRIYPPYYMAATLSITLLCFMPWRPEIDMLGMTLVPGFAPGTLGIEWTLVFETAFYVVLFALSWAELAKWVEWFAGAWLAAVLATTVFAPAWQESINPPLTTVLLSSMNIAFAAGLFLPRLMKTVAFWPLTLLIGLPLVVVTIHDNQATLRWAGGLACVLLVGAVAQLPQIEGKNWLSHLAIKFGDWSYATYLLHCTVLWLLFQTFAGYQHPTRIWLLSLVSVALVTWLFGSLDVAAYRLLRRRVNSASDATRRAWGTAYIAAFLLICLAGTLF